RPAPSDVRPAAAEVSDDGGIGPRLFEGIREDSEALRVEGAGGELPFFVGGFGQGDDGGAAPGGGERHGAGGGGGDVAHEGGPGAPFPGPQTLGHHLGREGGVVRSLSASRRLASASARAAFRTLRPFLVATNLPFKKLLP